MTIKQKIADKLVILKNDPTKFLNVMSNVIKTRLGLVPKPPKEGNRFSTDMEVAALQKYAGAAKVGIVEIGILDGLTTKEMAKVAAAPIYGIDPIITDSMNSHLIGHEEKIKENLEFYKQFYFFKDFSYNVVKNWQKKFDFIFIDGDHTYEAVKQDYEQWSVLLEPRGIIAFHDSATVTSVPGDFLGWPGPIRLVSELKSNLSLEFLESADSLSVFKKII